VADADVRKAALDLDHVAESVAQRQARKIGRLSQESHRARLLAPSLHPRGNVMRATQPAAR
jgi:hypothetical protein